MFPHVLHTHAVHGMRLTRTRDSQNRYQQHTRRDSIAARKQFTVTSQALAPDHREPRLSTFVMIPFIPNTSSVSSQGLPAQISHYYHSVPTRCVTATGSYEFCREVLDTRYSAAERRVQRIRTR